MKTAFLRLLAVVVAVIVVSLVAVGYYNSPSYDGNASADLDELNVAVALVSIKYIVYEALTASIRRRSPRFDNNVFLAGYALTLAADMYFVFHDYKPDTFNLSVIGAFIFTPAILIVTLIILALRSRVRT